MRRIIEHGATATAIAIAALIIALIALFSPRDGSVPQGAGSDPASFAVPRQPAATLNFVQRALEFYDAEGREATIRHYNSPASVEGENYLFILDEEGVLVAHINQELLGQDVHTSLGVDTDGYRFGLVMLEATTEGMWVDYSYLNPGTGFRELKHSWVVRKDGLILGSGWYETQPLSVIEFV